MPAVVGYAFGPYLLQTEPPALLRAGAPVALSARQLAILHALVSRAGEIVSRDVFITTGWRDVAVSDSSLGKMILQLRQHLDADDPNRYITTISRHGYQFVAAVTLVEQQNGRGSLCPARTGSRLGRRARGARAPRNAGPVVLEEV